MIGRRNRQLDETDLSGTREQDAREKALAAKPNRVGGTLRAGARPAFVRGAVADASCKSSNIGEPDGLGNYFSQRAGDCVGRLGRVPLDALTAAVAAAQPTDRYVCFYWRDSGFSAGDNFADHALSFRRAVRQLCRNLGDHEPAAEHGVFKPGDCTSTCKPVPPGGDIQCRRHRWNSTPASRMGAATGVRVVREPDAAPLHGAGGNGGLQCSGFRA